MPQIVPQPLASSDDPPSNGGAESTAGWRLCQLSIRCLVEGEGQARFRRVAMALSSSVLPSSGLCEPERLFNEWIESGGAAWIAPLRRHTQSGSALELLSGALILKAKARNPRRAEKMLDDQVARLSGPALDQMREARVAMPFGAARAIQGKSASMADPAIASLMAEAEAFEILDAMRQKPGGSSSTALETTREAPAEGFVESKKRPPARRV